MSKLLFPISQKKREVENGVDIHVYVRVYACTCGHTRAILVRVCVRTRSCTCVRVWTHTAHLQCVLERACVGTWFVCALVLKNIADESQNHGNRIALRLHYGELKPCRKDAPQLDI